MKTIEKTGAWLFAITLLLFATASAFAEPATFSSVVSPTFSQPATGAPNGYRLYQGCDLVAQTKNTLVDGVYTSGKAWSVNGDTDSPPTLCIVAYNSEGEGPFDAVIDLASTPVIDPPGAVVNIQVGSCTVTTTSGQQYDCTVNLSQ